METRINPLEELALRDGRYAPEAFELVFQALGYTVEMYKSGKLADMPAYQGNRHPDGEEERYHVSGRELCQGFRLFVREEFGAMALFLLHRWGLYRTEDIGEIVFLMVEAGMMGKQEADTSEDFAGGYDFETAFASADEGS